jgi:hypothetical protein
MATVDITQHFESALGGHVFTGGSITVSQSITLDGDAHIQRHTIATATTKKVFDIADDLADFDFLYLKSDKTVEAEFVVADGGNVVVFVLPLVANIPLMLGSDASRDSAHTEDWGVDGTADTIDKITISNASGATANVDVAAIT